MRVLQRYQGRARVMNVLPAYGRAHFFGIQAAALIVPDGTELNTAKRGGAADLVDESVSLVTNDNLVATACMSKQRDQIAHRSAGDKDGRFLAQALGGKLFE